MGKNLFDVKQLARPFYLILWLAPLIFSFLLARITFFGCPFDSSRLSFVFESAGSVISSINRISAHLPGIRGLPCLILLVWLFVFPINIALMNKFFRVGIGGARMAAPYWRPWHPYVAPFVLVGVFYMCISYPGPMNGAGRYAEMTRSIISLMGRSWLFLGFGLWLLTFFAAFSVIALFQLRSLTSLIDNISSRVKNKDCI